MSHPHQVFNAGHTPKHGQRNGKSKLLKTQKYRHHQPTLSHITGLFPVHSRFTCLHLWSLQLFDGARGPSEQLP